MWQGVFAGVLHELSIGRPFSPRPQVSIKIGLPNYEKAFDSVKLTPTFSLVKSWFLIKWQLSEQKKIIFSPFDFLRAQKKKLINENDAFWCYKLQQKQLPYLNKNKGIVLEKNGCPVRKTWFSYAFSPWFHFYVVSRCNEFRA